MSPPCCVYTQRTITVRVTLTLTMYMYPEFTNSTVSHSPACNSKVSSTKLNKKKKNLLTDGSAKTRFCSNFNGRPIFERQYLSQYLPVIILNNKTLVPFWLHLKLTGTRNTTSVYKWKHYSNVIGRAVTYAAYRHGYSL